MEEKLLSIKEVAEVLGVSPTLVYSLAKKGKIPHIRITRKTIRFRPSCIEQWLKDNTRKEGIYVPGKNFEWKGKSDCHDSEET